MSAEVSREEQVPSAAVELRPITADDEPTLLNIYRSTREEELALTAWDEAQRAAFVMQQFTAQHQYYQQHYAAARFDLILAVKQVAGRLYVNRGASEVRIIDIALLPEFRGRGIGTTLLRRLQSEAALVRKPLTIHVERFNPALRLYQRLGFELAEDKGVYLFLRWTP